MRAAEIRTGADRVLIAEGILTEHEYVHAFAFHHGIILDTLADVPRSACTLNDEALLESLANGLLPLCLNGEFIWIVAPWQLSARFLLNHLQRHQQDRSRLRITTMEWLRDFIHRETDVAIACKAAFDLRATRPDLSAGTTRSRRPLAFFGVGLAVMLLLAGLQTSLTIVVDLALAFIFLSWSGLRVFAIFLSSVPQQLAPVRDDAALPLYSVIAAIYNEAESVPALIEALKRIDYPRERLDIKIVVERDDTLTRHALNQLNLAAPFEIVVAPSAGPRTKPKALNAALPFSRGQYVVVYDAEDRPDPLQLRIALAAFESGDVRLACVQARLTIDNTEDSWLTRLFTAEYAGLFDVFLPGLAAFRMPLPLGGTSNHFHTATLRKLGGWDPYNVTEDADLGIRLARMGLHTTVIPSSTHEEAPARVAAWIKQRSRWFKGYLQTWAVHMHNPLKLWHDLGAAGFVVFQMVVGGAVLAALVHGVFIGVLTWQLASGLFWPAKSGVLEMMFLGLYVTTLTMGYVLSALLGFIGLSRRRALDSVWYLIWTPLYWLLLSTAAWYAIYQLIRAPYHWEKTQHGLARNSRRAMSKEAYK
ncbi:glycosyltransferase family 2 protein [Pseudorhodoplanes sinuspersici]|uniref:glycosyltransferase family 2 protein n=1 Tax=Pseudorhodoplanes sinuspersici TaxID=1235591 RepID=UPI0012FD0DDD|nr:glycosyltransferase [Pseudorhodoplanes sinuspersici]